MARAVSSSAVSSAVMSGDVIRRAAITSSIARNAVFSRGSRRAGAIWLIDSSPENASQELAKPTSGGHGRAPRPRNWSSTRLPLLGVHLRRHHHQTTRLTVSDAMASTAVSTADSRMPTVEEAEQDQRRAGGRGDELRRAGTAAADVLEAADRRDRGGQEVADADQDAAQAADHRPERVGRDRHNAAAVRVARRDVDVLEREEDEGEPGRPARRRRPPTGAVPPVAKQMPGT